MCKTSVPSKSVLSELWTSPKSFRSLRSHDGLQTHSAARLQARSDDVGLSGQSQLTLLAKLRHALYDRPNRSGVVLTNCTCRLLSRGDRIRRSLILGLCQLAFIAQVHAPVLHSKGLQPKLKVHQPTHPMQTLSSTAIAAATAGCPEKP